MLVDLVSLNLGLIFLNHGKPMTLGVSKNNTISPLPTESLFGIVEMINSILCFFLGNCIEYGNNP